MRKIILASKSPRRRELFELLGLPFSIEESSYEEDMTLEFSPVDLAIHLSEGKAREVAGNHRDAIVIGADSIVVLNGRVIGKPKDASEAKEILKEYSGKDFLVITGVTILDSKSGDTFQEAIETKVYCKEISDEEIDGYVATGEPLDRAGAIAVQGLGAIFVDRIEGDFVSAVGLPLSTVYTALEKFDIDVWETIKERGK